MAALPRISEPDAIELLRQAVAIRCEPEHGLFEGPIADFYASVMRDIGMVVEAIEVESGRPSVVGLLRGSSDRRSLFFSGHLNSPSTEPIDWHTDPYRLTQREDRLYGMGVADMKAAIVGMILGVRAAREVGGHGDLIIGLGAASERAGLIGTKEIIARGHRADGAIVGEPTNLRIVDHQRGAVWADLTVVGRSALTGGGVNAIHRAIPLVLAYLRAAERLQSDRSAPLGGPTLSINLIGGGVRISTVPNRCTFSVDRRLAAGEVPELVVREIERVASETQASDPGLDVEITYRLLLPPVEPARHDSVLVQNLIATIETVLGDRPPVEGIRGFTEMIHFREAGIDAAVCGPGDVDVVHAPNEYVSVGALVSAARVYAGMALSFARR